MGINDKKILFLLSPNEKSYFMRTNMPPLSLGILQGYLRERSIAVHLIDLNNVLQSKIGDFPRITWKNIYDTEFVINRLSVHDLSEIEKNIECLLENIDFPEYDLVGISLGANVSFFEIHTSFLMGKIIQERWKKEVVFGGGDMQYLVQFREELRNLWNVILARFKYLFIGPGEESIHKLIISLDSPEQEKKIIYECLPGAIFLKNGNVVYNAEAEPTFTLPDFRSLDLNFYKMCINKSLPEKESQRINEIYFYKWDYPQTLISSVINSLTLDKSSREYVLFIPYIFNFDCPFNCAFCVQSGKPHSIKYPNAIDIVDNIEILMKTYNTQYFYFFNNTFNFTPQFVNDFCGLVKKRKLKFYWSDCARFNNLTEEMIKNMYDAGCRKLVFGFETGSEKILRLIDKRLDLNQARQVLQWCKKYGIWANVEVIVGLPYELEEDYLCTEKFLIENKKYINDFTLNSFFVVPDSLIGRHPEKYGVKLLRLKSRYPKLSLASGEIFINASDEIDVELSAKNFKMYLYEEIDGRNYQSILNDTNKKLIRAQTLSTTFDVFNEIKLFNAINNNVLKVDNSKSIFLYPMLVD
jgi:radical SAM superfamily enzyme YgiQ (UPF0313 family)